MPVLDPRHRVVTPPSGPANPISRRQFLAGLGVLAGAGGLVPLLRRVERERPWGLEVMRPGLGTWIRVVVRDGDRRRAERATEAAFAAIAEVDRQMSVHRPDSQLSRVNRAAGRGVTAVDPEVIEVVGRACAAAERSAGLYDPTVLPLMRLYGYYGEGGATYPSDRAIARTLAAMGWRQVVLDPARGTLGLEHAGAGLDLGSIGKGWALDRAVEALRRFGIRSALVDVGGNSYGLGTPEPGLPGWSVGVLHPVTKQVDRVFTLRDAAVATSGNYEQFRILSGLRVGHLFDASRGRPADGHLSASVVAGSGVESDVMSTVSFLLGPSAFRGWLGALDVHFIG